jgi:cell division protein FtsN
MLLYLVILACVAGLFLIGLELGRNRLIGGKAEPGQAAVGNPGRSEAVEEGPVEVFKNLTPSTPAPPTETSEAPGSSETSSDKPPVEEPTRTSSPEKAKPESSGTLPESKQGGTHYTIQVAAHSSEQEAQQTLLRLEAKGFSARIQPPIPRLGDRFYRVWVGEFDSIEEARSKEAEVKAAGFLTYVRKTE